MTTSVTATRATNREVSRAMLIFGSVLVIVGIILTFTDGWLSSYVLGGGGGGIRNVVRHLWSVVVLIAYPLGSFMIVGAIIVNRLPESASRQG